MTISWFVSFVVATTVIVHFSAADRFHELIDAEWSTDDGNEVILRNIPEVEWTALYQLFYENAGEHWYWRKNEAVYGIPWNFTSGYAAHNPCSERWQYVECSCLLSMGINGQHPVGYYSSYKEKPEDVDTYYYYYGYDEGTWDQNITELECSILKLQMIGIGLQGQLSSHVGNLTNLTALHLDRNDLTGDLSPVLSKLRRLEIFSMAWNSHYTGPFPLTIEFSGLKVVMAHHCAMTGSISNTLSLPSLVSVAISSNHLSGTMPEFMLAACASLDYLVAYENFFTGSIPLSWSVCQQLTYFVFTYNLFSGPVPAFLITPSMNNFEIGSPFMTGTLREFEDHAIKTFNGTTSISRMERLGISGTQLEGTLPDGNFWNQYFPNLKLILLVENHLSGTIPHNFCEISGLLTLQLFSNSLTGTIPQCLYEMASLQNLLLTTNFLEGNINCSLLTDSHLSQLDVALNHLSGALFDCPHVSRMTNDNFQSLRIDGNSFSGTVPLCLLMGDALLTLIIAHNSLHGFQSMKEYQYRWNTPSNITKPLRAFAFNNNPIAGTFPIDWLPMFPELTTFAGASTCLFPDDADISIYDALEAFCTWTPQLSLLSLDGANAVCTSDTGQGRAIGHLKTRKQQESIPLCIFQDLHHLERLMLSGTGLSGSLPNVTSFYPALRGLIVTQNRISGSVPALYQQRYWDDLDLSYNKISGTLELKSWFGESPVMLADAPLTSNLANMKISLIANRLSDEIPAVYSKYHWDSVSVLAGNLFGCNIRQNDLPAQDPGTSTYSCGSNSVNVLLGVWILILIISILCALFSKGSRLHYWARAAFMNYVVGFEWMCVPASKDNARNIVRTEEETSSITSMHAYKLLKSTKRMIRALLYVTTKSFLWVLVIVLPVYSALGTRFKTHTNTYVYYFSSAYTTGAVSTIVYCLLQIPPAIWLCSVSRECLSIMPKLEFKQTSMATTTVTSEPPNLNVHSSSLRTEAYQLLQQLYIISILTVTCLVQFTVIVLVNVGFLYTQNNWNLSFRIMAQCAMSVSKLVMSRTLLPWSFNAIINHFINKFVTEKKGQKRRTQIDNYLYIELILNTAFGIVQNVIAPCFATLAYDVNCFYDAFLSAPPLVNGSYDVRFCSVLLSSDGSPSSEAVRCNDSYSLTFGVSFQSRFQYSYLCMSSLLSNYCFVFVFMVLLDGTVKPLIRSLHKGLAPRAGLTAIQPATSSTLNPGPKKVGLVLDHSAILSVQVYLVILFTFGITFIPLGVLVSIHLINTLTNFYWVLDEFNRHLFDESLYEIFLKKLSDADDVESTQNTPHAKDLVKIGIAPGDKKSDLVLGDPNMLMVQEALLNLSEKKISNAIRGTFFMLTRFVIPLQFLFAHYFLFDILGDAYGWQLSALCIGLVFSTTVICAVSYIQPIGQTRKMTRAVAPSKLSKTEDVSNGADDTMRNKNIDDASLPNGGGGGCHCDVDSETGLEQLDTVSSRKEDSVREAVGIGIPSARPGVTALSTTVAAGLASTAHAMVTAHDFHVAQLMEQLENHDQLMDAGVDMITLAIGFFVGL